MTEATIKLKDVETSEDAIAVIRSDSNSVAICLSVLRGSDVEVVVSKADALALSEALKSAVS